MRIFWTEVVDDNTEVAADEDVVAGEEVEIANEEQVGGDTKGAIETYL